MDGAEIRIGRVSGVDYLRALRDGIVKRAPMITLMDLTLTEAEVGRVTFEAAADARFHNPFGGMHGGWYGTVLDTALGCAVLSTLPAGRVYTTLEYKVNLVRTLPEGALVTTVGMAQHSGRSTAIATAEMRDAEGRLCASGSTTCLVMDAR